MARGSGHRSWGCRTGSCASWANTIARPRGCCRTRSSGRWWGSFFAQPEQSIRGWERALDAQARIVGAVRGAVADWREHARDTERPDLVFVAHGAVGALLLAALSGAAISRDLDQPRAPAGSVPGSGGGYYFRFALAGLELEQGWRAIDELPSDGR